MEVTGLVIGIAGLAGLFSACIDSYQVIQRGITFDKDYKILRTKFDNQELRLYAWGTACGLNGSVQDDFLNTPEVHSRIAATLECIKDVFEDQVKLRRRYGLRQPSSSIENSEPLSLTSSESESSSLSSSRHSLGTFFRRKRQQRSMGVIDAAKWAIEDYQKFSELVQHLKDLNDDLESFTRISNIMRRQRVIVQCEVEEIEEIEVLQEVEQAGHDDSDIVSDTASIRLASIREGSIRTLSIVASSTNTRDSVSYHTARSSLSIRERFSIELGRDDFLAELAGLDGEPPLLAETTSRTELLNTRTLPPLPAIEISSEQQSTLPVRQAAAGSKSSTSDQVPVFKVLAAGPKDCNSIRLLQVLTLGHWPSQYQSSFFSDTVLECRADGKKMNMLLADTTGEQDYPRLRKLIFTGTNVVLLCFRADEPLSNSTRNIEEIWLPEISALGYSVPIILVGIHDPDAEETPETGPTYEKQLREQYAKDIGAIKYYWCSPLTGAGIDDIFELSVQAFIGKVPKTARTGPSRRSRLSTLLRGLVTISEDAESASTSDNKPSE